MKITSFYISMAVVLFTTGLAFSACEKINDMPPITDLNTAGSKTYKQPDPTINSTTDKQEADSIAAEYERGIKQ